jgi:hypothetical protein
MSPGASASRPLLAGFPIAGRKHHCRIYRGCLRAGHDRLRRLRAKDRTTGSRSAHVARHQLPGSTKAIRPNLMWCASVYAQRTSVPG